MGNAHAANWSWGSAPEPPPPTPTPEPPSTPPTINEPPKTPQSTPADSNTKTKGEGLGSFEELHKLCKDIAFQPFEGIRFVANKGLSSHFQVRRQIQQHMSYNIDYIPINSSEHISLFSHFKVQHTVHLNNEKSSYSFGSTFVGSKQPSPTEAFPVMVGEMNNDGNLQAQFIHQVTNLFRLKCIAQTAGSKLQSLQVGGDFKFKDSTLSVVTADPDFLNGTGMMIVHYLQAITPRLAIGSELLYQKGASRQQAVLTMAGKYATKDWQLAGTLGTGGLHASFYRKANENTHVGVELEASLKNFESVTSFAYLLDIPKMNLVFKGMLTSEWTVGSSIEKKLLPLPISLNLTGTYNIKKDKVAVGIGAVLG